MAAAAYVGLVLGPEMIVVAQAGTLGGLLGLHALQNRRYHPVGSAGHKAAGVGAMLLIVGVIADAFLGARNELVAYVLILGLGALGIGLVLSGIAIVVAPVAPRWVGALLIAGPLAYFPLLALTGGFGGPVFMGVVWLSVAIALLSSGDMRRPVGPVRG